ncbi:MAG: protein-glutamate O-methyltransferase [Steroidobacter sp.]
MPTDVSINDREFAAIRELAYRLAGISMGPGKKALIESRWRKRLKALGLGSYREYVQLIGRPDRREELQTAIDLLTTNETYFFREPRHFDHLRDQILKRRAPGVKIRIWSAACSSGEEPYSIAMLLADVLGNVEWEVMASDLSTTVLAKARAGHFPMTRAQGVPEQYLRDHCLKGTGPQQGTMLIAPGLRKRVQFMHLNLLETPPQLGPFQVIFLRNVMIYFDLDTKRKVIANLLPQLAPGGFLYVGHSETLNGVVDNLDQVSAAIYRKAGP